MNNDTLNVPLVVRGKLHTGDSQEKRRKLAHENWYIKINDEFTSEVQRMREFRNLPAERPPAPALDKPCAEKTIITCKHEYNKKQKQKPWTIYLHDTYYFLL